MKPESALFAWLRHCVLRGWLRLKLGWQIMHQGAVILVLALSPSSYRREHWGELARQIHACTVPVLLWFMLLSSLMGLVLIRILVVTALGYGLSNYAVDMVVRVLVLELIPLGAALFVATRVTLPQSSALLALREQGGWATLQAQGRDPLQTWVLPRALAAMCSVFLLAGLSCVLALGLTYVSVYGFTPWALASYVRMVGHVFSPVVSLIFVFKTLFFALIVALVPLASAMHDSPARRSRERSELQSLARMVLLLLFIEAVSLLGNYY
ncbi:MAG TPA: ABC transporter permease [Macromonas sp.]|nr:ABC transporter permease [Macromonas sp.]